MNPVSVESLARNCKLAMSESSDRQAAAASFLRGLLEAHDPADLIHVLEAAIPPGADIGEMVVHTSPELTMLYARIPPRFQSGIHNHTIFACIGQLEGEERNTFFEPDAAGKLREVRRQTIRPGEVLQLPADAIHCIENPGATPGAALHLYGGDFTAVHERRSLWTTDDHERRPFSFPELLRESAMAMKRSGNEAGLIELKKAIPAAHAMVDQLPD